MMTLLRIVAAGVACAAMADPVWHVQRPAPLPVDIHGDGTVEGNARATAVRARLADALRGEIDVSGARPPAAIVFTGERVDAATWPQDVPVSIVISAPAAPNVRFVHVSQPAPVTPGRAAVVEAELEAIGVSGRTSHISLDDRGNTVTTVQHTWTNAHERHTVRFSHVPALPGVHRITVRADALTGETRIDDNAADLDIVTRDRTLQVLVHERRPSWNATFIRRTLETDHRFRVSTLANVSRGFSMRDAAAPPSLAVRPDMLDTFDVVLAGAPEDLTATDVDALARFARIRGGAVVLLADRRPSGPFTTLINANRFSEVLLENPAKLSNEIAPDLRASELIVPEERSPGAARLVTVGVRGASAPAASVTSLGDGLIVFWGAADAWRFRADAGAPFARFWRSIVADLAAQAPPPVGITLDPASVRPNESFTIRVRVRSTELREEYGRTVTPDVAARVVSSTGAAEDVRLWPAAEWGLFIGRATAAAAGRFDVHVTAGERSADAVLDVTADASRPADRDVESLRIVANATGGVVATDADLSPIEAHLRGQGTPLEPHATRPMRSGWWFVVLAACLCGEWAIRRRRGLP